LKRCQRRIKAMPNQQVRATLDSASDPQRYTESSRTFQHNRK
jgi:hypothetical protein